jgi:hypothetical protein
VVDLIRTHAGLEQLGVQDASQIHVGPSARAQVKHIVYGAGARESGGDIMSGLETAAFDMRSYGCDEMMGVATMIAERIDDMARDILFGSAPAGMDGCHESGDRVGHQDGSAIGNTHATGDGRLASDESIALPFFCFVEG